MKLPKIPYWPLLIVPSLTEDLGMWMNKITVALNGGLMPVLIPNCDPSMFGDDLSHGCLTSASHLKLFCDWINFHSSVQSLGDLTITLGDTLFIPGLIIWATLMIVKPPKSGPLDNA